MRAPYDDKKKSINMVFCYKLKQKHECLKKLQKLFAQNRPFLSGVQMQANPDQQLAVNLPAPHHLGMLKDN